MFLCQPARAIKNYLVIVLDNKEEFVAHLLGCKASWDYKPEDDTTTRYGFVADEVMEVIDDMVEIEPKAFLGGSPYVPEIEKEYVDDFKHLPTGKLIPFLVNAIKELSKEIEKLKSG